MPDQSRPARDLIDNLADGSRVEVPELDHVQYELGRRVTRLGVMLEEALAEQLSPWGLTKADYGVLSALRSAGEPYELRPRDLRARVLLTSGGVSNVVNRLEKSGHIERARDDVDGRSTWVRLTPAGVEVATTTMRTWAERQRDFFRGLPDDLARNASSLLREVLLALGDHEPPAARTRTQRPASVDSQR